MNRNKKQASKKGAPEWMITWSDMVSLLFCFFVLLYAMSTPDIAKMEAFSQSFRESALLPPASRDIISMSLGNGILDLPVITPGGEESETEEFETREEELTSMYSDFLLYIIENNLEDMITLIEHDTYVQMILANNILFDSGRDDLRPEAFPLLEALAGMIRESYSESRVEIVGHTDNDPINTPRFPNNWFLSFARAINVGTFFVDEQGFSPDMIWPVGRGEFEPIAHNDTEENKAMNRRVEIKVHSSFVPTEFNVGE